MLVFGRVQFGCVETPLVGPSYGWSPDTVGLTRPVLCKVPSAA
jgi:hypothetical protein